MMFESQTHPQVNHIDRYNWLKYLIRPGSCGMHSCETDQGKMYTVGLLSCS